MQYHQDTKLKSNQKKSTANSGLKV